MRPPRETMGRRGSSDDGCAAGGGNTENLRSFPLLLMSCAMTDSLSPNGRRSPGWASLRSYKIRGILSARVARMAELGRNNTVTKMMMEQRSSCFRCGDVRWGMEVCDRNDNNLWQDGVIR